MSAYTQSIQLMVTASQANINEIKVAEVLKKMAGTTGLEPATSDVTGRSSNQLNYVPEGVETRR